MTINVQTLIRNQLAFLHDIIEQAVADLTPEQLNHKVPASTIASIGGIYVHVVTTEDRMVNNRLAGKEPIFIADGWSDRLGFERPRSGTRGDWTKIRLDNLPLFRDYAAHVYAATDAYLAALPASALDNMVELPIGEKSAGYVLGTTLVTHAGLHGGEICALKGVQGLKGLPF